MWCRTEMGVENGPNVRGGFVAQSIPNVVGVDMLMVLSDQASCGQQRAWGH